MAQRASYHTAPTPQLPGSHYQPAAPFVTARVRHNDSILTDRIVDANKTTLWRVVDFSERHAESLQAIADERRQRRAHAAEYDRRVEQQEEAHSVPLRIPRAGDASAFPPHIASGSNRGWVPAATSGTQNSRTVNGTTASSSLWMKMADACRGDPNDPAFWAARETVVSHQSYRVPITVDFERRGTQQGETINDDALQKNVSALKEYLTSADGHAASSRSGNGNNVSSRWVTTATAAAGIDRQLSSIPDPSSRTRHVVTSFLSNLPLTKQLPLFLANLTLKRASVLAAEQSPQSPAGGAQRGDAAAPQASPSVQAEGIHYPFTEIERLMGERQWTADDVLTRLGYAPDALRRLEALLTSPQYLMQCYPDGNIISRFVTLESISVNALVASQRRGGTTQPKALSIMNDGDADGGDNYAQRMFLSIYGTRDTRSAPVLGRLALDQMVDVTLGCAFLSNGTLAHLRNAADGEASASMRLDPKDEALMAAGVAKFVQQHRPKAPKLNAPATQQTQYRQAMGDFSSALEATFPALVGPPIAFERRLLLPSRQCFSVWFLSDDGTCATVVHFVTENADLTAEWLAVLRQLLILNDAKRITGALGVSLPDALPPAPAAAGGAANKLAATLPPRSLDERRWHCVCRVDEAQRVAGHGVLPPTAVVGTVKATSLGPLDMFSSASFQGFAVRHKDHFREPPANAVI